MTDKIDLTGLTPKEIEEQFETRSSDTIRIYATDGGGAYPIHGAFYNYGEWVMTQWQRDGVGPHFYLWRKKPQPPQPRVLWAVYSSAGVKICTHEMEDRARIFASRLNARVVKMVEAV